MSKKRHGDPDIVSELQEDGALEAPDAEYRASLVAGQAAGLAIARYVVRMEPIASASPQDLVLAIGPTLQRYLPGDVRAARRDEPSP